MLGDGKLVDLLKLFFVVRKKGGYDVVTRSGLWDLVAKEYRSGSDLASSIKLVYVKNFDASPVRKQIQYHRNKWQNQGRVRGRKRVRDIVRRPSGVAMHQDSRPSGNIIKETENRVVENNAIATTSPGLIEVPDMSVLVEDIRANIDQEREEGELNIKVSDDGYQSYEEVELTVNILEDDMLWLECSVIITIHEEGNISEVISAISNQEFEVQISHMTNLMFLLTVNNSALVEACLSSS
ncbi:hypothetical protein COLO4_17212 [Corchorus olitorius]|uniref:ARID domain-containing protein n=1 Tax=Corchorus olitorius TaxID=93759 RepID=A0A1R3JDP0_9ROSI|nr:hypothetical protein COLO4_17212 [Corchorus olitorius]